MEQYWKDNKKNFYNTIFKSENNHWRTELFFKFDKLFTDIILGNYKPEHKKMLEVGSDGRFFETFFKKSNINDLNVSILDLSVNAINIIKNKFPNINAICEDFFSFCDNIIEKEEKYDIIFSNGTYEHFEDVQKALVLTKKILSKNGFFLMAVPNNLGYDINKDDQTESFRELNGGSHQVEWHLFLDSWKKLIENTGFKYVYFRGFDERIGFIFYMYL